VADGACNWTQGVRGFKPDREDGIFKGNKTSCTTSFAGEEKQSVPSRKILRHVKELY
jgi:hypothetical protein